MPIPTKAECHHMGHKAGRRHARSVRKKRSQEALRAIAGVANPGGCLSVQPRPGRQIDGRASATVDLRLNLSSADWINNVGLWM